MKNNTVSSHYTDIFKTIFSCSPHCMAKAPARANLIGEHTDYNHGYVMPVLLTKTTVAVIALAPQLNKDEIHIYSTFDTDIKNTPSIYKRLLSENKQSHWSDYVVGSLREIKKYNRSPLPGMYIYIDSDIPSGVGISSSAALEVAIIRATSRLLQYTIGDLQIAKMAQRAENEYIAVPCGLMDQMVISMGMAQHAMCINFFNNETPSYEFIPLFNKDIVFLLINSGISHQLATNDKEYATRFAQCQKACSLLSLQHLSELTVPDIKELAIDNSLLKKRIEHVVYENQRVIDAHTALLENDVHTFARLMNESHTSQRDLYQTSIPEIDALCTSALEHGSLGTRLTGGGFGGSIVVLTKKANTQNILDALLQTYPKASLLATINKD